MKAHPYLGWELIIALLTAAVTYVIHLHVDLNIMLEYLVAINIVACLLYRYDKLISAHEDATRIPNLVLAAMAIFGGSIGSLCGIYWKDKHKISAKYFPLRACVWLSMLAHAVLIYCYFFNEPRRCREIWDGLLQRLLDA
jgi:uncharacterized membrane protein YsdA (DUF1294 family)